MPARFGAIDTLICPECKNSMSLTRRTPHPIRGHDFELQKFTCRVCIHEIKRDADHRGEARITPETRPPTLWPPKTTSSDKDDCEQLDRALNDLIREDLWINDFIKRLNYTIGDMVRKK
jgi:hypothetical protein